MRCLALAQAWQAEGGRATFITACDNADLRRRLLDEGFKVIRLERAYPDPIDWKIVSERMPKDADGWIVLDGYHFDSAYRHRLKQTGHQLLTVDDGLHLDQYQTDVVLNQNINAERLPYRCKSATKLLLGNRYALLRSDFLAWQTWQRHIPEVARRVLVTLGGSDPENVTLKVIRALQQFKAKLEVKVIVGPANPNLESLQKEVEYSPSNFQLIPGVRNMPELMAWADVAVSGAGSTCWELAFMGLPSLLIILAENQREIATGLQEYGTAVNVGTYWSGIESHVTSIFSELSYDVPRRRSMSERGRALIDGRGAGRVATTLMEVSA
jgi:UDP-2,4-diacetamido-2,4,6-trideoxy-beta-L-altropyranose hydrolase